MYIWDKTVNYDKNDWFMCSNLFLSINDTFVVLQLYYQYYEYFTYTKLALNKYQLVQATNNLKC